MALGAYGIKRPSDVLPDDVQIIVHLHLIEMQHLLLLLVLFQQLKY